MQTNDGKRLFIVERTVTERVYVVATNESSAEQVARDLDDTEWARNFIEREVNTIDYLMGDEALDVISDPNVHIYSDR